MKKSEKTPKNKSKVAIKNNSEQRIIELTNDLQRLQADFVNYRRRIEQEQTQIMNSAKESIIINILPILDNIERALMHVPRELREDPWAKGVASVAKQALNTFDAMGVEKIMAIDQNFDPALHEAVGIEEGDGESEVVVEELQSGYKIGNRVIRPSMVKVGKK